MLGLLANPNNLDEAIECENWLYTMLLRGINVYSSDLCDYEVRRSLILASQKNEAYRIYVLADFVALSELLYK